MVNNEDASQTKMLLSFSQNHHGLSSYLYMFECKPKRENPVEVYSKDDSKCAGDTCCFAGEEKSEI